MVEDILIYIYSQMLLECSPICHDITYSTAITAAEHKSYFELTKDIPYLTLKGIMLWDM